MSSFEDVTDGTPEVSHIRNFCIIAHIDHGKSTLADRLLEATGTLAERDKQAQYLDRMDLERERGITIKAQAVRMAYTAKDGKLYQLNLIDTPGHVDFGYEVSRSLAACEGALLVVDASQGVEAQTLANVYMALDSNLEIIVVINKIDLPAADPERVRAEIEETVGLDCSQAVLVSAKSGLNIPAVLEAIVTLLPPPRGDADAPLRALITDSWWDAYRGVISLVRIVAGTMRPKQRVRFVATERDSEVLEVGVFSPVMIGLNELRAGEVGYTVCNIKEASESKVGDTIGILGDPTLVALPGFKQVQPMVFAGIFPTDNAQYGELRDALGKLILSDSAITYEPEASDALGFGFRLGFLGLLHMEIVQERLEREYDLDLITTAPSVKFRVFNSTGECLLVENPARFPEPNDIEYVEEPTIRAKIQMPEDYVGPVLKLCQDSRGVQIDLTYLSTTRVQLTYSLPLAEVVFGFYDRLKSISKGYASIDYEASEYQRAELVRLDLLVNGEKVDALSLITHKDRAYNRGRDLCEKMKEEIPRQQWEVAIQAAIGARVIARSTVKALRKDVLAKCYGGDISRKRKLLEKQKKGKRRLKAIGNVEIPQGAFHAILKIDT